MVILTCPCLNISIHVKNTELKTIDQTTLGLSREQLQNEFFLKDIAAVQLDIGGITQEQSFLIEEEHVADWITKRCINCNLTAYAVHATKGLDRVLVTTQIKSDPREIEELRNSEDFSPLYRILCFNGSEDKSTLGQAVTVNHDSVKTTINALQQNLSTYLSNEKEKMDERIRQYMEEQKEDYMKLQKKAYSDKSALIGLILQVEEQKLKDSISEAMIEGPLSPPTRTTVGVLPRRSAQVISEPSETITKFGELSITGIPSNVGPQQTQIEMSSDHEPSPTVSQARPRKTRDADTLFDLEGFTEDCEPFFESDDDDGDDNSLNEESMMSAHYRHQAMARAQQQQYAQSVPIRMPMWKMDRHSLDDEEKAPVPEPDKMVASMKALAQSVHDGTEMFGDLPRPRINTGDFKKARP